MTKNYWLLAVDFGTTNTAAATVTREGAVQPLLFDDGSVTMPSAVYVESPTQLVTGANALHKAQTHPAGLVSSPKKLVSHETTRVNGNEIEVADLIAEVLVAVIKQAAQQHGGEIPTGIVLTHPEAWSEREVAVLVDGAMRIGFAPDSIKTVAEPIAAAHHYQEGDFVLPGQKFVVIDIGSGATDVAVLESKAGTYQVLAARRDDAIGGGRFDSLIRTWVDQELSDLAPGLGDYMRTQANPAERNSLNEAIRQAKQHLSTNPVADITVRGGEASHTLQLTQDKLEELIGSTVVDLSFLTGAVLADAGISAGSGSIDFYLTGGSSRIPLIQKSLERIGGVIEVDEPNSAVASGALLAVADEVFPAGAIEEPKAASETSAVPSSLESSTTERTKKEKPHAGTSRRMSSRAALGVVAAVAAVALAGGAAWLGIANRPIEANITRTTDEIAALLPTAIDDGVSRCWSNINIDKVYCEIDREGPDAQYFKFSKYGNGREATPGTLDYPSLMVSKKASDNPAYFERKLAKIKREKCADDKEKAEIIKSDDGMRGAKICALSTVFYVDSTAGIAWSSDSFKDATAARQYFADNGLL
ncbi:Hsp70 family protein [Corynebacterium breve]|uniref:Hsp70 family protein n=1 Tax=Corynebacterium breve TaxID=3049799 RepID=A0ABY8VH98_9CORY|nr:Hsp70 family protein [Corynebacterium breve]WIM68462.1 Hsp70 family protein [Corynebacterium breve]